MKELRTEIEIDASAAKVWAILTDLARYAEWNPFIPEAEGEVKEGERLRVRIAPPGGKAMVFTPTVTLVEPERAFRWLGRLLLPGIFDGEHIYEITPLEEGRVRAERTISVRIPPGVDDGVRLRLAGEGEAGSTGAPHGDLYVVLHVREHPVFHRDGRNILIEAPISFAM